MGHRHDIEDDEEYVEEQGHSGGFLTGVLLGGLLGVGAGLLLAPAAGQDTRHKLRDRALSARDQARQAAEDARLKADDLQNSGREMLEENKRRIVRTAEAVKQSAQEAWKSDPKTKHGAGLLNPTPVAPERSSSAYNMPSQTNAGQTYPPSTNRATPH